MCGAPDAGTTGKESHLASGANRAFRSARKGLGCPVYAVATSAIVVRPLGREIQRLTGPSSKRVRDRTTAVFSDAGLGSEGSRGRK
jgi:hypothetical protein